MAKRTLKREKVQGAQNLYRRWNEREDGKKGLCIWAWRGRIKGTGKVWEVSLGMESLVPEPLAIELARATTLRAQAGWSIDAIRKAIRELLITLSDQELAKRVLLAKAMSPLTAAQYAANVRALHETQRQFIDVTLPEGGV